MREKTLKTWKKKYGETSPTKSKIVKNKMKEMLLEKYGVDNVSKIDFVKKKKKKKKKQETTIKNYGVEHHWKSEKIKENIKKTTMEKYGIWHSSQNDLIKEKKKNTLIERYDAKSPFGLPGVRDKRNKTMLDTYGTINSWLNITKKIIESGETLVDWYKQQPEPKIAYNKLCSEFLGITDIKINDAKNAIINFPNKTKLETKAEEIFLFKHYNKVPENFVKKYKPDFMVNKKTFINVDGLYWHGELIKNKRYHFNLRKEFEKFGYKLFQFREDEINKNGDIAKSIVDNYLNISYSAPINNISFASVKKMNAEKFLNENHIKGKINAQHFGMYSNNKLLVLISYKIFKNKKYCKILRICSNKNYFLTKFHSKIFIELEKHITSTRVERIEACIDLRYESDRFLSYGMFIPKKEKLEWCWTDGNNTYNKTLFLNGNEPNKKVYKIYDAGRRKYVKHPKLI